MLDSIEYLSKKPEFHVGDVKNLAVATNQKDDMSKMYPKNENVVSNADMLSQSFGGKETTVTEPQKVETPIEPVNISAIPNIQNSFNMEANPVDLNVNKTSIEPINMGTQNLNKPKNETASSPVMENNAPVIEPINPINSVNDNSFNVSNQPNIFDNPLNSPFSISQEDINKPLEVQVETNTTNNPVEVRENISENNIFAQSTIEPTIPETNSIDKEDSLNDDIVLAQIAIEESNVKHYEALAENSKKKIEILKRQVKNKKEEENLENTASNLFNNNGILDDEKVLGKTPMPNIMAA